jgi:hypothetical protein
MDVKAQIVQRFPDLSWEGVEELARLLAPPKKKCEGHRPPPCGAEKNCAGFSKGYRCAAHETCLNHEDKDALSDRHAGERRHGRVGEHRWEWD